MAVKREGGGRAVVHGVAQCVGTVSESGCGDCLRVAYGNLQRCPPDADGRAFYAGCLLRYSNTDFTGGSKKRKNVIIGGAVGGVAAVVLLSILLFVFFARSKKTKKTQKGNG